MKNQIIIGNVVGIVAVIIVYWSILSGEPSPPTNEVVVHILKECEIEPELNMDAIFDRICVIETQNRPDAIGDGGASWGISQIQNSVIIDVNDEFSLNLTHNDAFDVGQSRRIFKLYMRRLKRRKGISTEKEIVRCWNGGPNGHTKSSTLDYWKKYKNEK